VYFSNGFPNFYEEIKTYYPRFYDEVLEMDAIWRANGKLIDDSTNGIDLVINNNFIITADSLTLTRWEQFLGLETDAAQSLDARRNAVLAFISGDYKISASSLKESIKLLAGVDVEISFETQDEYGNFILKTEIVGGNYVPATTWKNIFKLYQDRLPAHIATQFGTDNNVVDTMFIGGAVSVTMNY
jgi:hypothetical protein